MMHGEHNINKNVCDFVQCTSSKTKHELICQFISIPFTYCSSCADLKLIDIYNNITPFTLNRKLVIQVLTSMNFVMYVVKIICL
jgi:hypothetical protein